MNFATVMASTEAQDPYLPGTACTVNTGSDMHMMVDARKFFGASCVIVKRTKAGLIQIALASDNRTTYSFPQRNVDLKPPNVGVQRLPKAVRCNAVLGISWQPS